MYRHAAGSRSGTRSCVPGPSTPCRVSPVALCRRERKHIGGRSWRWSCAVLVIVLRSHSGSRRTQPEGTPLPRLPAAVTRKRHRWLIPVCQRSADLPDNEAHGPRSASRLEIESIEASSSLIEIVGGIGAWQRRFWLDGHRFTTHVFTSTARTVKIASYQPDNP